MVGYPRAGDSERARERERERGTESRPCTPAIPRVCERRWRDESASGIRGKNVGGVNTFRVESVSGDNTLRVESVGGVDTAVGAEQALHSCDPESVSDARVTRV